jgi:hypothetical protein
LSTCFLHFSLFSAEFSHILLRCLWRFALSLSGFMPIVIFLSFLFPPLLFCLPTPVTGVRLSHASELSA